MVEFQYNEVFLLKFYGFKLLDIRLIKIIVKIKQFFLFYQV